MASFKLKNSFYAALPSMLAGTALAACLVTAQAQSNPPLRASTPAAGQADPQPVKKSDQGQRRDPAKFQQHMAERQAKHQADFKAKLKITPAQEAAWTSFTNSMKPPAPPEGQPQQNNIKPSRDEFAKLTTPERLDRMQKHQADRQAEMQKRFDATRSFYAVLTPDQQKVFDAETAKRFGPHDGPHQNRNDKGQHRHFGGPRGDNMPAPRPGS